MNAAIIKNPAQQRWVLNKTRRWWALFIIFLMSAMSAASGACTCGYLATGSAGTGATLERVKYNNPGLIVDLGVGLWAWPLPMDYDSDGDYDIVASCPDKPYNGMYFFENMSGNINQSGNSIAIKEGLTDAMPFIGTTLTITPRPVRPSNAGFRSKPAVGGARFAKATGPSTPLRVKRSPYHLHAERRRSITSRRTLVRRTTLQKECPKRLGTRYPMPDARYSSRIQNPESRIPNTAPRLEDKIAGK